MAIELSEALLFIVIGLVVGIAIVFVLIQARAGRKTEQLKNSIRQELDAQFQQRVQDQDRVYEQRRHDLDSQVEAKKAELDNHYKSLYASEFDRWKAEYIQQHEEDHKSQIRSEVEKALPSSRSALKGKATEQLAPLFPEFTSKYVASDARFIGSPVDFIVFKNLHTLSGNNSGERKELEIVFVEVKTGSKTLNPNERAVRAAVENLRIKYDLMKLTIDDGNNKDTVQYEAQKVETSSSLPTAEEFKEIEKAVKDLDLEKTGDSEYAS